MGIRIFDSLSREKVELDLREPGRVSMYVCGPTVYDVPHVGHGRTAVVFDVVRRYFEWRGLEVQFVSNVTDVDDKIIARAAELASSEAEIAARFEDVYRDQMQHLGVRPPDQTPHATEHIGPMLELVGELVASEHAYVVTGQGVYFDVASFDDYGALPGRTLEQLIESAGARVEIDQAKRSPVDFALWKAAKPGEPAWDSPWGAGRPGWHIECSAMSLRLLGERFDVHGAGDDLVFPHNENERAQAEAAGHRFARHWIHSGMVEVGGEKMSKSLGNFTTLAEALDAHGPRAFRLAVLQSYYRKAVELGDRELRQAAAAVERIDSLFRRAGVAGLEVGRRVPDHALADRFRDAMDDDLATPAGLGVVFEAVSAANQAIDAGDLARAGSLLATVRELVGVLGLFQVADFAMEGGSPSSNDLMATTVPEAVLELVKEREEARHERDFATADRLRDEIAAAGFAVEDTSSGPIVHRVGGA